MSYSWIDKSPTRREVEVEVVGGLTGLAFEIILRLLTESRLHQLIIEAAISQP